MVKKNKYDIVGYYFDGKVSYKLYKDENGEPKTVKWKDNKNNNYGDYSGIDHDSLPNKKGNK